jgi:hypothetical protein
MDKILKAISSSSFVASDQFLEKYPEVMDFFKDVESRAENEVEITPEFMNKIPKLAAFSRNYLEKLKQIAAKYVFENFEEWEYDAIAFVALNIIANEDKFNEDFKYFLFFKFFEAIIEMQDSEVLNTDNISIFPIVREHFNLSNSVVEMAYEKLIISFFNQTDEAPDFQTLLVLLHYTSRSSGWQKSLVYNAIFAAIVQYLKTNSLSITYIQKLVRTLEIIQLDVSELYNELIAHILESNFTLDVFLSELSVEDVVDFLLALLKYSKTENAILINMALKSVEMVKEMSYINSLKALNCIMDFDGFSKETKENLAAKIYKIVEKKREEIKLGKYEMVGVAGIDENVENEVTLMLNYDKDRVFN